MKEITAIIRMNKINDTKHALVKAGLPAFTARKVLGRGKGHVDFKVLRGAQDGHPEAIALLGQPPRLIPKRMLTIVVPDEKVSTVIKTIIRVNQSGNAGDGKIFVQTVTDAIRIRTGETAELAVDEMNV
jgi:nitrogen regulatory protein PII 2